MHTACTVMNVSYHRRDLIKTVTVFVGLIALSTLFGAYLFEYKHTRDRSMKPSVDFQAHYHHHGSVSWYHDREVKLSGVAPVAISCPYDAPILPINGQPCYKWMSWMQWATVSLKPRYCIFFIGVIWNILFPCVPAGSGARARTSARLFGCLRLFAYVLLSLYRIFALYFNLNYLMEYWIMPGFDFSDHIVLFITDAVILGTETYFQLVLSGLWNKPLGAQTLLEHITSMRTQAPALMVYFLHTLATMVLASIASYHTSRAFHFPMESLIGLLVGVLGAAVVGFWGLMNLIEYLAPLASVQLVSTGSPNILRSHTVPGTPYVVDGETTLTDGLRMRESPAARNRMRDKPA